MYCIIGGKPYLDQLKKAAANCKAIISWGSCASWGCVQAARPNPTRATPVHQVITMLGWDPSYDRTHLNDPANPRLIVTVSHRP